MHALQDCCRPQIPRLYKFVVACIAEFLGVLLFTFSGSATPTGTISTQQSNTQRCKCQLGALTWCYLTLSATLPLLQAYLATIVTGHMTVLRGLMYMLAQLFGACFGILLLAGLVPQATIGMGNSGVGCFVPGAGINYAQTFGWEFVMTFVLVSTVYAVAVGEPSFGDVGPLAVGLSLFAMVFVGSQYTGSALNPARTLGPAIVFHCHWDSVGFYLLGEFLAGAVAGLCAGPLYGTGAKWLKLLLPWHSTRESPIGPNGALAVTSLTDEDGTVTLPQLFSNGRVKTSDDGPKQRGRAPSVDRVRSGDIATMV
eukprot:jgi/Astpho2/9352/Aster-07289